MRLGLFLCVLLVSVSTACASTPLDRGNEIASLAVALAAHGNLQDIKFSEATLAVRLELTPVFREYQGSTSAYAISLAPTKAPGEFFGAGLRYWLFIQSSRNWNPLSKANNVAQLEIFPNLNTTCITKASVERILKKPSTKTLGVDGASSVVYAISNAPKAMTNLQLIFQGTSPCAVDLDIGQFQAP